MTVSKTNISFNGWTGCGYIIVDPNTGGGAYMISGGFSGGQLFLVGTLMALSIMFLVLALLTSETGVGLIVFGFLSYATAYGALATFFGKVASDKFMECLTLILSKEILNHYVVENYLVLETLFDKIFMWGLVYGLALRQYNKCVKDLYESSPTTGSNFRGQCFFIVQGRNNYSGYPDNWEDIAEA